MPDMPLLVLLLYCAAIVGASLLGGMLPTRIHMTHTRTQLALSLVSGLMLGVAFYHLLPHSIVLGPVPGAIDHAVWWLVIGLVVMFLLLRMFHFHQHEFGPDGGVPSPSPHSCGDHAHEHMHPHEHEHTHSHKQSGTNKFSWVGIALGLSMHTLIDGVALGAALRGAQIASGGPLGAGVFLAIFLHKPLDAMSVTAMMRSGGSSLALMRQVNIGFALICPLGALLFYLGVDSLGSAETWVVSAVLAFAAGAFVCIALSDLLPEVQFHSHDRIKLTVVFIAGIALAWAIGGMEPSDMHEHAEPHVVSLSGQRP